MYISTLLLALPIGFAFALPVAERVRQSKRAAGTAKVEFFPPAKGGGSMLDSSAGLGEPLNIIISGRSSPGVLTDSGFVNYVRSIGFSTECLDLHAGTPQTANLGDGHGAKNQIKVLRQDFGHATVGTCFETLEGGNHLRYWRQNGPTANSGALFLAVSVEENLFEHHTIAPNGYDEGRDKLVSTATSHTTSFDGVNYVTTKNSIKGLLPVGSAGINHGIAIDGVVTLLTVTIQ